MIDDKQLNELISHLYKKIEDGTMEQNSNELWVYMWLSELKDRRSHENTVFELSKLFKFTDSIKIGIVNENDEIEIEDCEIKDIYLSDYAFSEVKSVEYNLELIQSCENVINVIPLLLVERIKKDE